MSVNSSQASYILAPDGEDGDLERGSTTSGSRPSVARSARTQPSARHTQATLQTVQNGGGNLLQRGDHDQWTASGDANERRTTNGRLSETTDIVQHSNKSGNTKKSKKHSSFAAARPATTVLDDTTTQQQRAGQAQGGRRKKEGASLSIPIPTNPFSSSILNTPSKISNYDHSYTDLRTANAYMAPGASQYDEATAIGRHFSIDFSDDQPLMAGATAEDNGSVTGTARSVQSESIAYSKCAKFLWFAGVLLLTCALVAVAWSVYADMNGKSQDFMDDKRRIALSSMWMVGFCSYLAFLVYRAQSRKRMRPFRSRNWPALLVSLVAGLVLLGWADIINPFLPFSSVSCSITRWIVLFCYAFTTAPYLFRAIRLWLLFRSVEDTSTSSRRPPTRGSLTDRGTKALTIEAGSTSAALLNYTPNRMMGTPGKGGSKPGIHPPAVSPPYIPRVEPEGPLRLPPLLLERVQVRSTNVPQLPAALSNLHMTSALDNSTSYALASDRLIAAVADLDHSRAVDGFSYAGLGSELDLSYSTVGFERFDLDTAESEAKLRYQQNQHQITTASTASASRNAAAAVADANAEAENQMAKLLEELAFSPTTVQLLTGERGALAYGTIHDNVPKCQPAVEKGEQPEPSAVSPAKPGHKAEVLISQVPSREASAHGSMSVNRPNHIGNVPSGTESNNVSYDAAPSTPRQSEAPSSRPKHRHQATHADLSLLNFTKLIGGSNPCSEPSEQADNSVETKSKAAASLAVSDMERSATETLAGNAFSHDVGKLVLPSYSRLASTPAFAREQSESPRAPRRASVQAQTQQSTDISPRRSSFVPVPVLAADMRMDANQGGDDAESETYTGTSQFSVSAGASGSVLQLLGSVRSVLEVKRALFSSRPSGHAFPSAQPSDGTANPQAPATHIRNRYVADATGGATTASTTAPNISPTRQASSTSISAPQTSPIKFTQHPVQARGAPASSPIASRHNINTAVDTTGTSEAAPGKGLVAPSALEASPQAPPVQVRRRGMSQLGRALEDREHGRPQLSTSITGRPVACGDSTDAATETDSEAPNLDRSFSMLIDQAVLEALTQPNAQVQQAATADGKGSPSVGGTAGTQAVGHIPEIIGYTRHGHTPARKPDPREAKGSEAPISTQESGYPNSPYVPVAYQYSALPDSELEAKAELEGDATPNFKNHRVIRWMLVCFLPLIAFAIWQQVTHRSLTPTYAKCQEAHPEHMKRALDSFLIADAIFHAFWCAVLVVAALLMRVAWRELRFMSELLPLILVDASIVAVRVVYILENVTLAGEGTFQAIVALRVLVFFLASFAYPLWKSYVLEERMQNASDENLVDLSGSGLVEVLDKPASSMPVADGGTTKAPLDLEHTDLLSAINAGEIFAALESLPATLSRVETFDMFSDYLAVFGATPLLNFYIRAELFRIEEDPTEELALQGQIAFLQTQTFAAAVQIYLMHLAPNATSVPGGGASLRDLTVAQVPQTNAAAAAAAVNDYPKTVLETIPESLRISIVSELDLYRTAHEAVLRPSPQELRKGTLDSGVPILLRRTLFVQAQSCVLDALETYYWPGFRQSPTYLRLYESLRKQIRIHNALYRSRMLEE